MRGVTLIELLAGMSLFLILLHFSFHAFESQHKLLRNITVRSQPEQESNYRLLLMKHFLERSSRRLKLDPLFEGIPIFFADLSFGKTVQPNAFSLVHISGEPIPFVRTGISHRMPLGSSVEEGRTYLLAGSDPAGNFTWNYAAAEKVWTVADGIMAKLQPYTSGAEPEKGKLVAADLHGFVHQNQTLYWVSPSGTFQPFLTGVNSFRYDKTGSLLHVRWSTVETAMEFRCAL